MRPQDDGERARCQQPHTNTRDNRPYPFPRVSPEPTLRARWDTERVWIEVTPSLFPHEHEGLEHVRAHLPDEPPYRAWSNFTFRTHRQPIPCYEVDLLVLAPSGLHLVELKAWRGPIRPAGP